MTQWGGCMSRIRQCLRHLLLDEIDEETIGLFEEGEDKVELSASRRGRNHHYHRHHHQHNHLNGARAAHPANGVKGNGDASRPRHKKVLRAKDASYSESIIQDFRREEIPTELAKLYDLQDIIGIGTTSKVYKCKRRARKEVYACKVIDKRKLNMEVDNKDLLLEQLRKEIEILQHLSHPSIVEFEDVIETADKIFVIMELVQGGELFEYLLDRGPLPEEVAVHIMRQVMSAITYMHDRGVVHRDLKAENLLVVDPTADFPTVKLIDFGFSTILRHNLTGSFLGTGGYLAPEIRQQRLYSESVDIWACGVLLYLLLSCRLPFNAEVEVLPSNRQQVERKFEMSFPEQMWQKRSESVKNLLRRMLATDPMRRFTAQQVIRHPWILYGPAADQRSNTRPPPPVVPPPPLHNGFAGSPSTLTPAAAAAAGKQKHLLENPQESSGTYGGNQVRNGNGKPMPIPPSLDHDGSIRHVRSSMNLERMMIPVNVISRTPPAMKRPPLRPATTMGGGHKVSSGTIPYDEDGAIPRSNSGGRSGSNRASSRTTNQLQKPVLVSYMPQTLHNSVAGDLSSTSNLSMKYSSMNASKRPPPVFVPTPQVEGGGRR